VPITITQSKTAFITSASTSHPVTFDSPTTVGSWVVIVWRQGTDNRTPSVPVPSAGTWSGQQDWLATTGSNIAGRLFCWSAQQTGSGTATYTITVSAATATGSISAYELAGVDVSGTPRGGSGTQSLTTATSHNVIASPGIDLSSGNIVVAGAATNSTSWGTLTAPSNFSSDIATNTTTGSISTWIGQRTASGTGITAQLSITTTRPVVTGYQVYLQEPAAGGQPFAKRLGGVPHNAIRARRVW
jgi:hypothetical protein